MGVARDKKAGRTPSRATVLAFSLFLIVQLHTACRQSQINSNTISSNAASETFDTPPFQTREPERYEAVIVTTGNLGNAPQGETTATEQRTFVARDGLRRRTEFDFRGGVKLVMLDMPTGHFILMPSRNAYADLAESEGVTLPGNAQVLPQEFSSEILNNEARGRARYERLGVENVLGREAVKYRVTTVNEAGEASGSETLIWVDESLGMPVRSETVSGAAKFTMEMLDIKRDVDLSLFDIPANYRKESVRDFYAALFAEGENPRAQQR
ncbi:MAG TPA: hypothetical protein VK619_08445 [Pyrinomonadaceae bacterium]|nr:hypothetical protein [Pyrinomonadaceae bacterium]